MKKIFIPIKEESVRVPNKNFRDFGGVPLFIHGIKKFLSIGEKIYIDTDAKQRIEDDILKYVGSLDGITVYSRKESLVGGEVSVNLLIENFIMRYCKSGDIICQLHVTNPFLKAETVKLAMKNLDFDDRKDSVVGCNTLKSRLWRTERYGVSPINHNPLRMEPTQDLCNVYEENSTFYIFRIEAFKKLNNRIGYNPLFSDVPFPENLDIDYEKDFDMCLELNSIYGDKK